MPATLTKRKLVTAEQLLAMGSRIGRCELLHGEIRRMSPAGAEHGVVAMRFGSYLLQFVEAHGLGEVFAAETGYILDRDPDTVRAPDASFVKKDRIPKRFKKGFFPGPPDLAVEVISPDDSRREIADKINMWLARGTAVVWEADPATMTVTIHRVGVKPLKLGLRDSISEEPLLPGFVLPLSNIFKLP